MPIFERFPRYGLSDGGEATSHVQSADDCMWVQCGPYAIEWRAPTQPTSPYQLKSWYRFSAEGVQLTTDPAELRETHCVVTKNEEPVAWADVLPFDHTSNAPIFGDCE